MKVPKKPTGRRAMPFYWWRRFRSHKCLPYKASLLSKIENGDFIKWYASLSKLEKVEYQIMLEQLSKEFED